MKSKFALIAILIVVATLFFALDLDRWLTFEALRESQTDFAHLYAQSPWIMAGGFFALYVIVAALTLPGAAIMTIAAGALFGLTVGTVLVSFASSLGATLAFLASRYLLRDAIQQRFGDKLSSINEGVSRDGAFYLFTLRLLPLFPFFLVNVVMGLTPIRTVTFYWVSQVGMLAGTMVYVNAGTQLAQLEGIAGLFSPGLIASFTLLGLFPLLARSLVRRLQRRRVYARWQRPKRFDRNLIVIGGGAAGLVSAYIAAAVKAKVTLVEMHKMGGDCLNTGCVPSKALIATAKLAHQIRHAQDFGISTGEVTLDFRRVMSRVHEVIRTIEPHDSVERYTDLGVEVLQGHARLIDPWTVEITQGESTQRLTSRSIVIATGARPVVPALPGIEQVRYVTSDTLWSKLAELDAPPRRLLVLGGGPIGCELAQCMARLGSHVTLIERSPRLLVSEDTDVSDAVSATLRADGVEILTNCTAQRCERNRDEQRLFVHAAHGERALEFDLLLCAVGRAARLTGFGLEELGITTERTVNTNEYLETVYPNIYAAGDVAGPFQFTHTASHQAWYASVNALFGDVKRFRADYSVIPRCTFVDPEIARVGINEQEAQQQGVKYDISHYALDDLDRAITDGTRSGWIKVLTVPGKDKILGVTIVGAHAGELLAEFVLAMKHGLGLNKILGTIHAYPTRMEANKYVAGVWKRAHAPQRVLAWAERYHTWRRG